MWGNVADIFQKVHIIRENNDAAGQLHQALEL